MFDVDTKEIETQRNKANTGDYKKLVPGGYVCQIIKSEFNQQYNSLRLEFEIVEGEFKGYAADFRENTGKDYSPLSDKFPGTANAHWKIAQLLYAVEDTNKNYTWNGDERTLLKKGVGVIMAEQESSTGKVFVGPYKYVPAALIREGTFKVPDKVIPYRGAKVVETPVDVFNNNNDDDSDLPF